VPNVQWKTPDDRQRNCPKHAEFLDKNKFGKISASVGFIKKKFVTMHGHMNIKHNSCCDIRLQYIGETEYVVLPPRKKVLVRQMISRMLAGLIAVQSPLFDNNIAQH
jgi:hypothetical protein